MKEEFERILYDFECSQKLGEKSTLRLLKALVALSERLEIAEKEMGRFLRMYKVDFKF